MPSFRALLQILELRPGHAPETVMDTAVAVMEEHHLVEAKDLDIVRGVPQILVRFYVPDTGPEEEVGRAYAAAEAMREGVGQVARTGALRVVRRQKGRWVRC